MSENPKYQYLERIVNAVSDGLKALDDQAREAIG